MKRLIYCLLLSLLPSLSVRAQEIIEHNGDTMIVISPNNLKTINSIIIDLEDSKKIINLQNKIIKNDSIVKSERDSIIVNQTSIINKQNEYYTESINNLEKTLKKEKIKKTIWTSALGLVAVIFGTIAISK